MELTAAKIESLGAPTLTPGWRANGTKTLVDVSVVIVNYNVREFLEQALRSVERASAGLSVEVFMVDNNSVDGSVAMVRERFPDVRVIANDANVGFATANNQAIREATGRYLLILNPDTLLQEDTLQHLVRFMDEHPEAGASGCRILNPDGSFALESRRSFPTPSVALWRISGLSRLFSGSPRFGRYNLTHLPIDQVCEVDALSGSCMMVRREALTTDYVSAAGDAAETSAPGAGLLDEDFFMYGEDLDWCFRIQQAGWKIYYTPGTQIIHYKGESTKKGELRYVVFFYGAMLRFAEKHFRAGAVAPASRLSAALMCWVIRAGVFVRAGISVLGRATSTFARPARDMALALAAFIVAAFAWGVLRGEQFAPLFFAGAAPIYALVTVAAVAAWGGYERKHPPALAPVVYGLITALVAIATLSYFIPDVAYSRMAIAVGCAISGGLLVAARRSLRPPPHRWALMVGEAPEAARLARMLRGKPERELRLIGYVESKSHGEGGAGTPPCLGAEHHLRDLVRLRAVDDVIFAAESLSNTAILGHIRTLRDLPVHFRILTSTHDRIIGKASVEDYTTGLVEVDRAVATMRPRAARRALEVPLSLLGIALHPLLRASLGFLPNSWMPAARRMTWATAMMPSVLAGRRALIGYDPAATTRPPEDWGITPGIVSILDTLDPRPTSIIDVHRAYWFYARNQSLRMDLEILMRAMRKSNPADPQP